MSAPTPKWSNEHMLAVIAGDMADEWPATPADVRLWLLDNGAVERQWCETHDVSADLLDKDCGMGFAWLFGGCRMVSVLVWRAP